MASLLALLSQQTPNLQTRKGLILLGLQNDFLSPDGKLRVSTESGFLDRIRHLVPEFRDFGEIIWVRSEYEADRPIAGRSDEDREVVTERAGKKRRITSDSEDDDHHHHHQHRGRNPGAGKRSRLKSVDATAPDRDDGEHATAEVNGDSDDEELFLKRTRRREPCCLPGTYGADYAVQVKDLVRKTDIQVVKTHYSGFSSTSLLSTLRSRLITELFVCGCNTNLSVYATAMDAARHGLAVTLVEDCLGYRKRERHDEAVRQLVGVMGARVMTKAKALESLRDPNYEDSASEDDEETVSDASESSESKIEADDDADDIDLVVDLPSTLSQVRLTSSSTRDLDPVASKPTAPDGITRLRSTAQEQSRRTPPQRAEPARSGSADVLTQRLPASRAHAAPVDDEPAALQPNGHLGMTASSVAKRRHNLEPEPTPELPHPPLTEVIAGDGQTDGSLAAMAHVTPGREHSAVLRRADVKMQQSNRAPMESQSRERQPLFGKDKQQESAGSEIIYGVLAEEPSKTVFEELVSEVQWQKMHHQTGEVPRLVCCQGTTADDGSMPVYRHPSDESMPLSAWTPAVDRARRAAEDLVGHPLNHALIQLYRSGTDYISEHSDKTLDIARDSKIVNVSFGAQRTMRFRTKRRPDDTSPPTPRTTYRVPLPHNSMLTVSLRTNEQFLHGIGADKRPAIDRSDAERAFGGQRVSITFRHIVTFLSADSDLIWGQGAVAKTRDVARPTVNGDGVRSDEMLRAFGRENRATCFDWDAVYGCGSDVLHLK